MAAASALLALLVLKPMRRAHAARHASPASENTYSGALISESARVSADGG